MTVRLAPSPLLTGGRLVAILRGRSATHLLATAHTLIEAGVRCLEITTNTPSAAAVVAALRTEWPETELDVGLGTVRTADHVHLAADSGAGFVVSPGTDLTVGAEAFAAGLRWYPGAATPTEIETAWTAGAAAVKVFPIASLGGASYLAQVRAPLDDVPLIPTGGIGIADVPSLLSVGSLALGVGGPLVGDALSGGPQSDLAIRARLFVEAVAPA